MSEHAIRPEVNDAVKWNGSRPIVSRLLFFVPGGIIIDSVGRDEFIPDGAYEVVGVYIQPAEIEHKAKGIFRMVPVITRSKEWKLRPLPESRWRRDDD